MTLQAAAALEERITLQQPLTTRDATGDEIVTWVTMRSVWAQVSPLRGREVFLQGASLAEMDTRIVIRQAADLTAMDSRWRVLHRGRVYDIYSVAQAPVGQGVLEILAKSGATQG
jgi:SPP1 family predicted phage head-tail adaptor